MERALKERIIGAAVLVIFVVLVVPVFLDGPPSDDEIVSERVVLPGQEGQDNKTVILDRERSVPVPAASSNQTQPESQSATPTARPKPQQPSKQSSEQDAKPPEAAASATGMWAVQLGSFSNKQNAEKLAADLRKQGYAAFLSQLGTDEGRLHRVRIGPQKDRQSAEAMAARLLKVGHEGQVVPHP